VNKVINAIDKSPQKTKSAWQKHIIKFALPAALVFGAVCFMIIGGNITQIINPDNGVAETPKSNNWFSLVAYAAEDTTFEITKDIKVLLPGGIWTFTRDAEGYFSWGWRSGTGIDGDGKIFPIPNNFTIEGENMKSVKVESKNGEFALSMGIPYVTHPDYASVRDFQIQLSTGELYQGIKTVYLENDDISYMRFFKWIPIKLIESEMTGDYKEYYTDTITITITFDDGEIMTQIAEITIDENTGEMFAQIIG
jgi:hypothetical protein